MELTSEEKSFSKKGREHAYLAKQFLEGALTLDAAQQKKGRILFVPTLSLAGHGLELMLKACIYLNGETPPTDSKNGHMIDVLWARDICEPVRALVYAHAILVAEEARNDPSYRGVPNAGDDVVPLIEQYVTDLAKLHGEYGKPLRYPSDSDKEAPQTPFVVKSLWGAADELIRRPDDFVLKRFRGGV